MDSRVPDGSKASHGKSFAMTCLQTEIDAHPKPRKALADDCDKSEQTFSKMVAGTQAFGLDDFEQLPHDLQVKWMKRYGKECLGLHVRELEPMEITEEFHALIDQLVKVAQMARSVGRPHMAHASIRERDERKRA